MRGLEDGTWRGKVGGVREDREGASDLVFFLTVHVKSCLFQSAFFAFLLRAVVCACMGERVCRCACVYRRFDEHRCECEQLETTETETETESTRGGSADVPQLTPAVLNFF